MMMFIIERLQIERLQIELLWYKMIEESNGCVAKYLHIQFQFEL